MTLVVKQHRFNALPWVSSLALGALLIFLATPGLIASYVALNPIHLADKLDKDGSKVTLKQLNEAIKHLSLAASQTPGQRDIGKTQIRILLDLYNRFRAAGQTAQADQTLDVIARILTASLKQAPGDANSWYLLAEVSALLNRLDQKALTALNMSYLTGPREGWIAVRRLRFSLRYWLLLDSNLKNNVRREIRTLWTDRSYQRFLTQIFVQGDERTQQIIYREIAGFGDMDGTEFIKFAQQQRWHGDVADLVK